KTARAGIGRSDKNVSGLGIVQSIIETGNRARAVAKRRVRRDVLDALAIDIDLAAIPQAFKVLGARERSRRSDHVLWLLPMHRSLRSPEGRRLHANILRARFAGSPIIVEPFLEFR